MSSPGASASLVAHIALLAIISFGGVPGVLPDLRDFVVDAHGWLSDREFANCFAIVQAVPGPNMILMMSLIGWKLGGLPIAIASAVATFGPPCALSFGVFHFWDRFRETAWQQRMRRGLAPVTIGLVVAGGWPSLALTAAAGALLLLTRFNPLWFLAAGGALGGFGLL